MIETRMSRRGLFARLAAIGLVSVPDMIPEPIRRVWQLDRTMIVPATTMGFDGRHQLLAEHMLFTEWGWGSEYAVMHPETAYGLGFARWALPDPMRPPFLHDFTYVENKIGMVSIDGVAMPLAIDRIVRPGSVWLAHYDLESPIVQIERVKGRS